MMRIKIYTGHKYLVTPRGASLSRRTVATYKGFTLTPAQFTQVIEQFTESRDFIVIPHRGGVVVLPTGSIVRVVGIDL